MPGPCLSHRFISVEPNIRHTAGMVLSARPIQATLQVPEVAPPQAFHLVHRFPPTERLKSSGGAAAGEQSGSRRTTACQRLELPAPAGGPRGGDPGLSRRGRAPGSSLPGAALAGDAVRFCLTVTGKVERKGAQGSVGGLRQVVAGGAVARSHRTHRPVPPAWTPRRHSAGPGTRRHAHCGRSAVIRARTRLASPLPRTRSREKQLESRPATCRGGSGRRSWWSGRLTPSTGGIRLSRRGTRGVALLALLLAPQWTSQGPAGWSGSGAVGWVCGGSRG